MSADKELLLDAIYHFGPTHQVEKAIEEMSELTKELIKHKHGAENFDEIAEEMGDVEITLEQLRMIFDNDRIVDASKQEKLRKLRHKIFEEKYPIDG